MSHSLTNRSPLWLGAAALMVSACVVHTQQSPPRQEPQQPPPYQPQPLSSPGPSTPVQPAPLPPQEPLDEPPATQSEPAKLPAGAANGAPSGVHPGAPAAFWIWHGPQGNWHLRTTTAQVRHTFRGRVASKVDGGPITDLKPSRVELGDRIVLRDGAVFFKFTTAGHIDGFDFRPGKDGCARFDLQLDGGAAPKRIFLGAQAAEPPSNHFVVCP